MAKKLATRHHGPTLQWTLSFLQADTHSESSLQCRNFRKRQRGRTGRPQREPAKVGPVGRNGLRRREGVTGRICVTANRCASEQTTAAPRGSRESAEHRHTEGRGGGRRRATRLVRKGSRGADRAAAASPPSMYFPRNFKFRHFLSGTALQFPCVDC